MRHFYQKSKPSCWKLQKILSHTIKFLPTHIKADHVTEIGFYYKFCLKYSFYQLLKNNFDVIMIHLTLFANNFGNFAADPKFDTEKFVEQYKTESLKMK